MDKHLNFGVYEATDAFRSIKQHSCVCFDDLGLVAVTGPAEDKESQKYAELFAAAPELLEALERLVDAIEIKTWGDAIDVADARAVIAKARGEVLEHAND